MKKEGNTSLKKSAPKIPSSASNQKKKKIIQDESNDLDPLEQEMVQPTTDSSPEDKITSQSRDEDLDDPKNTKNSLSSSAQQTSSPDDVENSKALQPLKSKRFSSMNSWLFKKVKDFSKTFSDTYQKWVPEFAKNLTHKMFLIGI